MTHNITQSMESLSTDSVEFKRALKILLKYEIHCLLQRLSDTGEEAIVITTSVDEDIPGHLATAKGEGFLQNEQFVPRLKEQFYRYCTGGDFSPVNHDELEHIGNDDTVVVKREHGDRDASKEVGSQMPGPSPASHHADVNSGMPGPRPPSVHKDITPTPPGRQPPSIHSRDTTTLPAKRQQHASSEASFTRSRRRSVPSRTTTKADMDSDSNSEIQDADDDDGEDAYQDMEDDADDLERSAPPSGTVNTSARRSDITGTTSDGMPKLPVDDRLKIKTKKSLTDTSIPVLKKEKDAILKLEDAPDNKEKIQTASSDFSPVLLKNSTELIPGQSISLVETITTCYICRQEFPNYESLKTHMSKHWGANDLSEETGDDVVTCGICDLKCRSGAMREHMKTHEFLIIRPSIKNACSLAVDYEHSRTLLEQPMQSNEMLSQSHEMLSDNDVVNCGICDYECMRVDLASHMECHNKEAESQNLDDLFTQVEFPNRSKSKGSKLMVIVFKCNNCKYTAYRRSRMREHVQSCAFKVPQFGCETCGKLFRAKRYLVLHRKVHEIEDGSLPSAGLQSHGSSKGFICHKCNYRTYRGGRLREHMLVCGVTEPKHCCKVCGKLFKAKRYLVGHMKAHTQGYYTCQKCGYNTDRKGRLNEHLQSCMATGLNFQCNICNKSFKARRNLVAHKRRACAKSEHLNEEALQDAEELPDDDVHLDNSQTDEVTEVDDGEGGVSVYNMLLEEDDINASNLSMFNMPNEPQSDDAADSDVKHENTDTDNSAD